MVLYIFLCLILMYRFNISSYNKCNYLFCNKPAFSVCEHVVIVNISPLHVSSAPFFLPLPSLNKGPSLSSSSWFLTCVCQHECTKLFSWNLRKRVVLFIYFLMFSLSSYVNILWQVSSKMLTILPCYHLCFFFLCY